jgi:pyruvate dehydrogenase E2 component (dihydrolipoamide acetyltransferase)
MARDFKLPDLGEGIHEGEIVQVMVSEGDHVEEDQSILEVETDKAAVEIPSPFAGTVSKIHVEPGQVVHVGDVLISFGEVEGAETAPGAPPEEKGQQPENEAEPPPARVREGVEKREEQEAEEVAEKEKAPAKRRKGAVPASPATRRLARELGVELARVPGTGPEGLVTSEDVRQFAERGEGAEAEVQAPPEEKPVPALATVHVSPLRPSAVPVPALPDFSHWGEVERVPLRSVRRATAKQMALAWSQIPHVNHQDRADITELETFRQRYKDRVREQGGSLTPLVFVMKAVVAALRAFPRFNSSVDADSEEIVLKHYYNLGIAIDTDRGLMAPVIREVDRKSIVDLATELKALAERTRAGEATLEDMQGGTFTITNIGTLGGTTFLPIINYPEVAILGMAKARYQPVVQGDDTKARIVPRLLLPLTLSFDHRVVDGADAARFMNMIVSVLEDPDKLLISV